MQKRFKYLSGALLVTVLALATSAATPHRAAATTTCGMIFCTNSSVCNVDACGGAGFCSRNHCVAQ